MKCLSKMLLIAACCCAFPVWSADINFRGFGSFTGGTTLDDEKSLYGYDENISFKNDSLMALQANADLEDKLSATMQIVARGNGSYSPEVEWAYLTYEFNESNQLSVGRIRIPFYRYSDFIDVRYAYNWLKAPRTVYGFEFQGYDGLSYVANNEIGDWSSSLQVIFGQFDGETDGASADLNNLLGFNWTVTRDWLTLRAGYMGSEATIQISEFSQLAGAVLAVGAGAGADLSAISDQILIEEDNGAFFGFAAGIDYENFLVDLEYIQYEVEDSLLPESSAYYASFGYRFGDFIPMITYSELTSESDYSIVSMVPPPLDVAPIPDLGGATLPQFLTATLDAAEEETTLIDIALRWDFHHSAAFKFALTQEENKSGDSVNLFRFGIDFVY